jgi:excinuclease UvrABC ATPase subunit
MDVIKQADYIGYRSEGGKRGGQLIAKGQGSCKSKKSYILHSFKELV